MLKKIKYNLIFFLGLIGLFILNPIQANALTNESSAVCNYAIGVTLTFKDGKLTYNLTDATGYKKYESYVSNQNLITSDNKLKCPETLYWYSTYNNDRKTTFYVYPVESKKANNKTLLTSETLNNPVETEENKSDLFSCNYGTFIVTTNGVDKLEVSGGSDNVIISSIYFTASEFGKTCKGNLKYQCATSMGKNYCAVAIDSSTGNGATLKNVVPLNGNSNINADELQDTQGKYSLLLINSLYDSLSKVSTDNSPTNQLDFYNKTKKVLDVCNKIYSDLSISESDEEYKKCTEVKNNLSNWAEDGYFGNRIVNTNVDGCEGILGSLGDVLSEIYNILKLAVPVIIVAMGFKDFIQGMSSGKDDALKKAGTNFIKRLVVGAVFVMLPILIKTILTFAFGGSFSDICIKL